MKTIRRSTALLALVVAPLLLLWAPRGVPNPAARSRYFAYVGTYTTKTASKGIYAFRYDADAGKLTPIGVAAETPDPSWVAIHPSGKYLYAVNEAGKNSMVSAFGLDALSGKLTLLNQLPALGEDPCYISFDKTGKYVLVANYTSGNVAVFPVLPDGRLGEHSALVTDSGPTGPNKERQEGPHAHWIETSPDNRFALVADLGLDEILVYKFDSATGTLTPNQPAFVRLKPGSGPRHAAFSRDGNFLHVLGELQSTVTVFAHSAGETFRAVETISALPPGFSERNDAAEIAVHPNEKFLYTSNRGHESIAVFSIDPVNGMLRRLENVPTGGKEPRHFAIDPAGKFLLAENQFSDSIVEFRIDPADGRLAPTGEVLHVPSPVCIAFAAAE